MTNKATLYPLLCCQCRETVAYTEYNYQDPNEMSIFVYCKDCTDITINETK